MVENRLRDEIRRGVQTIQYQVVTLMTTNGQAPFVTVFMYLNEAQKRAGKEGPRPDHRGDAAPALRGRQERSRRLDHPRVPQAHLRARGRQHPDEDPPYYYLTELAAKCTAKRMVPDYISEKKMRELKLSKGETAGNGDCYTCMGCRSFLTPDRSGNGFDNVARPRTMTRASPSTTAASTRASSPSTCPTWRCPPAATSTSSGRSSTSASSCATRRCVCRHERLKGTLSDAAPILWQYGALRASAQGRTKIDKLLYGGYSTISLGYAGLYECVKYMTGKSHTDPEATPFALSVMQKMNDKCNEWKTAENIDYSIYGTPLESTTYKFAKCLQKRFGIIEGITDHGYITNSYHVHVTVAASTPSPS